MAELQVRQQLLQKQQSAYSQLQSYQDEYFNKQQIDAARQAPVNASTLQNKSRFMADLNYAVSVQQQQLATAEQVASDSRSVWSRSYAKEQRWQELEQLARREQQLKQDKKHDQESLNIWSARHSCKGDNKLWPLPQFSDFLDEFLSLALIFHHHILVWGLLIAKLITLKFSLVVA